MKLVFQSWQKNGQDVYGEYPELSMGPFHAGTVFDCEMNLKEREKKELKESLDKGFEPMFKILSE